jgi:hypothetical protein
MKRAGMAEGYIAFALSRIESVRHGPPAARAAARAGRPTTVALGRGCGQQGGGKNW